MNTEKHLKNSFYLTLIHMFIFSIILNSFKSNFPYNILNPVAHLKSSFNFTFFSIFISQILYLFIKRIYKPNNTVFILNIISKLLFILIFIKINSSISRIFAIMISIVVLILIESYENFLTDEEIVFYETRGLIPTFFREISFLLAKFMRKIKLRLGIISTIYFLPNILGLGNIKEYNMLSYSINYLLIALAIISYVLLMELVDFCFLYNVSIGIPEFYNQIKIGSHFENLLQIHQIINNYEYGSKLIQIQRVLFFLRRAFQEELERVIKLAGEYKKCEENVERKRYYLIPVILTVSLDIDEKEQIFKKVKSHNYLSIGIEKTKMFISKKIILRKIENEIMWLNKIMLFIDFIKNQSKNYELVDDFYSGSKKTIDILKTRIYEIDPKNLICKLHEVKF